MNNNVSNETALSVRSDKPIVVSDGTVKTTPTPPPAPKKEEPKKAKKKRPFLVICIILAALLVLGAAGFFGYSWYVNKKVLTELTGTWIYDTATSEAGYISFLGDDQALVDGGFYNLAATNKKLYFERKDEPKIAVEYNLEDDELLLALSISNELFESCEVTVSGTDAGVMLYKVDSDPYLDDVEILEKYYEKFPKYAISDYIESAIDWDSLGDIFGGDFSYDDLEGYLSEFEDAESIEDFVSGFITGGSSAEAEDTFDFSDLLDSFISGYIGDFGDEAGAAIGDAVDGTEIEDAAEIMYDFFEFYNAVTDEDSSEEDIFGAIGDMFNW